MLLLLLSLTHLLLLLLVKVDRLRLGHCKGVVAASCVHIVVVVAWKRRIRII